MSAVWRYDHSTLNRWVLQIRVPLLETQFCARKRSVGSSWRDWTRPTVKVKGVWKYLYRAVDKAGSTVDFPLDRQTGWQSRVSCFCARR